MINEKTKRILIRNIIIIVLLASNLFFVYLLYDLNYFSKNKKESDTSIIEKENNENKESEEEKEKENENTLEILKEKYSKYLDRINISSKSSYLKDYYSGNLTDELKMYLAFNNVSNITNDLEYSTVLNSDIEKSYKDVIYGDYPKISFYYNNNKLRYIKQADVFISDSIIEKEKFDVSREITNIEEDNNLVIITTSEVVNKEKYSLKYEFKDGLLYNIKKLSLE